MQNLCYVETVRCAECGVLRRESNHFFVHWVSSGPPPFFCCRPMEDSDMGVVKSGGYQVACGHECLCKAQGNAMEKLNAGGKNVE